MKMSRLLVLVLLCFFTSLAFAQTDSLRFRKNEIGADFLPLLKQGGTSLLYRRHQQNAAWRVRIYGNFQQSYGEDNAEFYRQATIRSRVGREWHHDYGNLRFYYGLDLGGTYTSIHHSVQRPEWFEDHDRNLQGGLLPLLGFGYKINERFSVSAEVNAQISGGRVWQWSRSRWERHYSYIAFDALSEFSLFLSYRF